MYSRRHSALAEASPLGNECPVSETGGEKVKVTGQWVGVLGHVPLCLTVMWWLVEMTSDNNLTRTAAKIIGLIPIGDCKLIERGPCLPT